MKLSTEIESTDNKLEFVPQIGSFDLTKYNDNMDAHSKAINNKIELANKKLVTFKTKEKLLNDMVIRTENLLKTTNKDNFKAISVLQSNILKQIEIIGVLYETIIKYEDLVFKYQKMLIDVENHRINGFAKIKATMKDNDKAESESNTLMGEIHDMLTNKSSTDNTDFSIHDKVDMELKIDGY